MDKILIGTSGWGYDEWIGPFYPKGLTSKEFLSYYSKIYYTNEINTTFYNTPSRWVVDNWVKRTPEDFTFTAKLPKTVTHDSKLDVDECMNDLSVFLLAMEPLIESGKLLSFLVQLPPSFTKEKHFASLREFVTNWPGNLERDGYHLAVEFRHKSWMAGEVFDYLSENALTYCAVIEPLLPPRMDVTNPKLAYIRFHGYGKKPWFNYDFSEEEIKRWASSIKQVSNEAERVGIYFNNHFSGYAAKNAFMMMKELGVEPRNDPKEVSMLDTKKDSGTISKGQTSLDKYF